MERSTITAMWSLGKTMLGIAVCSSSSSSVGKGTTCESWDAIENKFRLNDLIHRSRALFNKDVI